MLEGGVEKAVRVSYNLNKMNAPNSTTKIVIVEDNASLADIYRTRLELLGYNVFVAMDGVTALDVIQKEQPHLVLLDLMVPKIAGDQILERMRSSDWGKHIPVFIISNLNEADAPKGLRRFGIEGYAVKANLQDDQLDQIVDQILRPADQKEDISLENPEPSQVTIQHDTSPSPPTEPNS